MTNATTLHAKTMGYVLSTKMIAKPNAIAFLGIMESNVNIVRNVIRFKPEKMYQKNKMLIFPLNTYTIWSF